MRLPLILLGLLCVTVQQVDALSYSAQSIGAENYTSSVGYHLNSSGSVVGKCQIETEGDTDFLWTQEKGFTLLNPKRGSNKPPLLNDNDEVIGWVLNPDSSIMNIYTYSIDDGFNEIVPPTEWKENFDSSDQEELSHPTFYGFSNKGEVLVSSGDNVGIWTKENDYEKLELEESAFAYSMNTSGKIFLSYNNSSPPEIKYMDLYERSKTTVTCTQESIGLLPLFTYKTIEQVLDDGTVLGCVSRIFEDKSVHLDGFVWHPIKGTQQLNNFIPVAGNTKGQIVGHTFNDYKMLLWDNGTFHLLQDLIDGDEVMALFAKDMNEKGQILIAGSNSKGYHAYILTPNNEG